MCEMFAAPRGAFYETGFEAGLRRNPEIAWMYRALSCGLFPDDSEREVLRFESVLPAADVYVSTRLGDVSQGVYAGFNPAHHVGDDASAVRRCRERLLEITRRSGIVFMDQTHSSVVLDADDAQPDGSGIATLRCDGLVCSDPEIVVAVMTADCLPLVLSDPGSGTVAAVHCGWRGLASGIVEEALSRMELKGAKREDVCAFMGPAIGPHSFEVGAEIKERFEEISKDNAAAFAMEIARDDDGSVSVVEGKFMCNIAHLAYLTLVRAGVDGCCIDGLRSDTVLQSDVFYSYRKEKITGRTATAVCLK